MDEPGRLVAKSIPPLGMLSGAAAPAAGAPVFSQEVLRHLLLSRPRYKVVSTKPHEALWEKRMRLKKAKKAQMSLSAHGSLSAREQTAFTEFSDYPEFPQDWPIEHSKSPDQGIYTPGPLGEAYDAPGASRTHTAGTTAHAVARSPDATASGSQGRTSRPPANLEHLTDGSLPGDLSSLKDETLRLEAEQMAREFQEAAAAAAAARARTGEARQAANSDEDDGETREFISKVKQSSWTPPLEGWPLSPTRLGSGAEVGDDVKGQNKAAARGVHFFGKQQKEVPRSLPRISVVGKNKEPMPTLPNIEDVINRKRFRRKNRADKKHLPPRRDDLFSPFHDKSQPDPSAAMYVQGMSPEGERDRTTFRDKLKESDFPHREQTARGLLLTISDSHMTSSNSGGLSKVEAVGQQLAVSYRGFRGHGKTKGKQLETSSFLKTQTPSLHSREGRAYRLPAARGPSHEEKVEAWNGGLGGLNMNRASWRNIDNKREFVIPLEVFGTEDSAYRAFEDDHGRSVFLR